jgi:hypothetical protein
MAANQYAPAVSTFSQTVGGTAQVMVAANPQRTAITIQPQTEAVTVNFGATAGVQATGTLTAGTNPLNTETIAVNGVTFTFVTGASTTTNVHIGATKEETMTNFAAVLEASVNAAISIATYTVAGAVITITHDAGGVDGNAFTLANSSGTAAVTRSAATLAGGLDSGNGFDLAVDQFIFFSAGEYPSIREDIYIVSATGAAKTVYLEGIMGG